MPTNSNLLMIFETVLWLHLNLARIPIQFAQRARALVRITVLDSGDGDQFVTENYSEIKCSSTIHADFTKSIQVIKTTFSYEKYLVMM